MDEESSTYTHGIVELSNAAGSFEVSLEGQVRTCGLSRVLRRIGLTIRDGDRVTVRLADDGSEGGEITQVRAPLEKRVSGPVPRRSLIARGSTSGLKPADQRLDRTLRPGWSTAADCPPKAGDPVFCTAGEGTLLRILGRTGNGSRLLELRLTDRPRAPFFAAATNVLVAPITEPLTR